MPDIWRPDYQVTALPPGGSGGGQTGISQLHLTGAASGRMAMIYSTDGYSNFPDVIYGDVRLQMLDPFGNAIGAPTTFASWNYSPVIYAGGSVVTGADIASAPGGMLAVSFTRETWLDSATREGQVFLKLFDAGGGSIGSEVATNINSTDILAGKQSDSSLTAFQDGSFAVVWTEAPDRNGQGGDGSGSGIYFQRFGASGAAIGGLTRVNTTIAGNQADSSITTLANGDALVTWTSDNKIYAQRISPTGALVGSETLLWSYNNPLLPGSYADIYSTKVVAVSGGGFALVWLYAHSHNIIHPMIAARMFDAAGNPVGGEHVLQTTAIGFFILSHDAVATPDGGVSIAIASVDGMIMNRGWLERTHIMADGTILEQGDVPPFPVDWSTIYAAAIGLFADGRELVAFDQKDAGTADSVHAVLLDGRASNHIQGTASADVLVGHIASSAAANDVIVALDGNDAAYGEGGNDYLYMGLGNDTAVGGPGVDVILLDAGHDYGYGGDGQDYIFGGTGNDTLNGEGGVDVLNGEGGDDQAYGGEGGDYFYMGPGNDTGFGDAGNDIFVMEVGDDVAHGGPGQDYFYMGDGHDTMTGGEGVDVMLGEGGNDVFEGGTDVDYMFLGTGNDTVIVHGGTGSKVVNDFTPGGGDLIRLIGWGFGSFADVQANLFDFGSFTLIQQADGGAAVWLIGVSPAQLTGAEFSFL